MSPKKVSIAKDVTKLGTFSSFGFIIISNVLVGLIIGAFLDNIFGTKRMLLVIFLILGIGSGLYNGFRYLLSEIKKIDADEKTQKPHETTGDHHEDRNEKNFREF